MYATREGSTNLKGIIVSGAIYKAIPQLLNVFQTFVFHVLPQSKFNEIGLKRKQVIHLTRSINFNLEEQLKKLNIATLLICGQQDKMNIKSSQKMNQFIKNSDFKVISGGGHELNKEKPVEFSILVNQFIDGK